MAEQASSPGDVVIEARDIVKRFGGAVAVDDVSIAWPIGPRPKKPTRAMLMPSRPS